MWDDPWSAPARQERRLRAVSPRTAVAGLVDSIRLGRTLNVKLGDQGSVRIKTADIVDLTATVMSWLRIYQPHSGQIDGKPLFDEDLNINLEDFEILEESRLDALEILFGRRVE
jgi:hypothetical protein